MLRRSRVLCLCWLTGALGCGARTDEGGLGGMRDAAAGIPEPAVDALADGAALPAPELSVATLVQQWMDAAYERGRAFCCSPEIEAPDDPVRCARGESGAPYLWREHGGRCAIELARQRADVRAHIRCATDVLKASEKCQPGACGLRTCVNADEVESCRGTSPPLFTHEADDALSRCAYAYYCGDERRDQARCNGVIECFDRSDEVGCGPRLWCGDGVRVLLPEVYVCDGNADCYDGSDEMFCEGMLPNRRFTCLDGSRLHASSVCNGKADCADGRDEVSCFSVDQDEYR